MKTRGGAYFADKVKETATLSRGELLGVELLRTGGPRNGTSGADGCVPGRLDHLVAAARAVAAAGGDSNAPGMLPARVLGGTGAGGGGGGGGCPDCFLLVVNFQIALDDGCFSIVVHVALPTAAQLHAEGTPWAMAALRFLGCSAEHAGASASGGNGEATAAAMDLDTYRNMRLKLIPHWVEAGWLVKSLAGSSPIKLGEYCPPRYHGDGATYLELDVDTSSSTVVSGLFGQLQSSGSDIVLQMGICVEATSSAELPELLLGAFELRRPDFGRAAVAAAGLLPPTATDRGGECVPSNTGAAVAAAAMGAEEGEQESLAADLSRRISTFFSADDVPSPASSGLGAGGRLGAAPTACHAAGSGRHEEEEGGGSLAEDLGRRVSNFFTSPLAFLDDEDGAEQRVCTSGGGHLRAPLPALRRCRCWRFPPSPLPSCPLPPVKAASFLSSCRACFSLLKMRHRQCHPCQRAPSPACLMPCGVARQNPCQRPPSRSPAYLMRCGVARLSLGRRHRISASAAAAQICACPRAAYQVLTERWMSKGGGPPCRVCWGWTMGMMRAWIASLRHRLGRGGHRRSRQCRSPTGGRLIQRRVHQFEV